MSLAPDGFRFHPKDHELITGFLVPKLDGEQFDGRFIHDGDIYTAAPDKLVAQYMPAPGSDGNDRAWYFFCPVSYLNKKRPGGRRSRTVATEGSQARWHAEKGPQTVEGSTVAEGYLRKFSYVVTKEGKKIRQGWCMVEYGLDHQRPRGNLVLCKLYRSPRAPLSESEESATSTEAVSGSGCKRKATDDHPEARPSVRRQWEKDDELIAIPKPILLLLERELCSDCRSPLLGGEPSEPRRSPHGEVDGAAQMGPEELAGDLAVALSGFKMTTVGEHTVAPPTNDVIKSIENLVMSDDPAPWPVDGSKVSDYERNLEELLKGQPPCAPRAEPEEEWMETVRAWFMEGDEVSRYGYTGCADC